MTLPLKKCPSCKFWWFDRMNYGCTKQEGRVTYPTTNQLEVEQDKIYCSDFRSKKMYEYLLQKESAKPERMIREGDGIEIENEKISKVKRMMNIHKRKYAKKKSEQEIIAVKVDKPKRMIRMIHDWLE